MTINMNHPDNQHEWHPCLSSSIWKFSCAKCSSVCSYGDPSVTDMVKQSYGSGRAYVSRHPQDDFDGGVMHDLTCAEAAVRMVLDE